MTTFALVILLAPLVGCIVIALTYRAIPSKLHGWMGTLAIAVSFAAAIGAFVDLQDRPEEEREVVIEIWDLVRTAGVDAQLALLLDPLSIFMALVVSGVSMLIHLYAVAYMGGDNGYTRFFSYLNFFVFSMLLLVLAANFFLLIVGWAFVGAASYLLISFWYRRRTATTAGIKAFVINVVGDVGLVLGTYFIFKHLGTLDFVRGFALVDEEFSRNDGDLVAGCLLILVGAFAKSAQVPLHTWLPDAMEGPTPVSALIHAATMVTAGVYLIARLYPLYEQAPTAAYVGGLFHLMTHAFFKALLFMAAGSVIAAMAGEQNLDRMGGFRRAMPFTFGCMVVGGLALSGIPPFSGFFSKDEILTLVAAREGWHEFLAAFGYLGAFLTAVYTWRMIFRAFYGEPVEQAAELEHGHLYHAPKHTNPATGEEEDTDVGFPGPEHHIAEREGSMKVAMGLLAVLATIGGIVQIPHVTSYLHDFLEPTFHDSRYYETLEPSNALTILGMAGGAVIGIAGIALAYRLWVLNPDRPAAFRARLAGVHTFFVNKWYFDELIDLLIVRPVAWFGRFGRNVFERVVVQGLFVGGSSGAVRAGSAAVRAAQSGFLRYYAALLAVGVSALGLYFLISAS